VDCGVASNKKSVCVGTIRFGQEPKKIEIEVDFFRSIQNDTFGSAQTVRVFIPVQVEIVTKTNRTIQLALKCHRGYVTKADPT
jgi:hypothetical protein